MSRVGLALICAAILASVPATTDRHGEVDALSEELAEVRAEIAGLEDDNAGLRRQISVLKRDTRGIEQAARDELGLVYPGELVIRIESGGER